MRPLWIRIGASEIDSVRVGRLADALELAPVVALGHLAAFCGAVARQRPDGDLSGVPDSLVEQWAAWTGARGRFAAAVREVLIVDDQVEDWSGTFGREVAERAKDAERKRNASPTRSGSGDSAETPRKGAGGSPEPPGNGPESPRQEKSKRKSRGETLLLAARLPARDEANSGPPRGDNASAADAPSPPPATPESPHAPASPSTDDVDDIAGADIADASAVERWAVDLTVALNQGVAEVLGEQPRPVVWSTQQDAAARILAIGAELPFVRSCIFAAASEQASKGVGAVPRSLAWFTERIRRAWSEELERRRAESSPLPAALPDAAGSGRFGRDSRTAADGFRQLAEEAQAELQRLAVREAAESGAGPRALAPGQIAVVGGRP